MKPAITTFLAMMIFAFTFAGTGCAVTPETNAARVITVRNAIVYPAMRKSDDPVRTGDNLKIVAESIDEFLSGDVEVGALRDFISAQIAEYIAPSDPLTALELQDAIALFYTPGLDVSGLVSEENKQRVRAYAIGVKGGVERFMLKEFEQ